MTGTGRNGAERRARARLGAVQSVANELVQRRCCCYDITVIAVQCTRSRSAQLILGTQLCPQPVYRYYTEFVYSHTQFPVYRQEVNALNIYFLYEYFRKYDREETITFSMRFKISQKFYLNHFIIYFYIKKYLNLNNSHQHNLEQPVNTNYAYVMSGHRWFTQKMSACFLDPSDITRTLQ